VDLIEAVTAEFRGLKPVHRIGRVRKIAAGVVTVTGLSDALHFGDMVEVLIKGAAPVKGEVVGITGGEALVLLAGRLGEVALDMQVRPAGRGEIAPDDGWIGRVIDPLAQPLDGRPLVRGALSRPVAALPPPANERRLLGQRLSSGQAVFDTFLPLVRGQRIGLFAGSGVGKSTLLAKFAQRIEADVVVIAMIGERGREVREFIDNVLGPVGLKRAVIVAATSDQSALLRRRCALTAMTVAEYFRDQGRNVLFLADSLTRLAEAHREIATSAGEGATMRGFPPSTVQALTGLCERAGPGSGTSGDITAIFSVLVAGSDMEEPVADIVRGVLDGHVVLDRSIAERGRFPAIDLLRSVSRSLPAAASEEENAALLEARDVISTYEKSELMIQAGLYTRGTDPAIDRSIALWPRLDKFLAENASDGVAGSYARLEGILKGTTSAAS
jgi:flagellum-specific ATP synthase